MKSRVGLLLSTVLVISLLSACGSVSSVGGTSTGNPVVADTSATGAVAGAVGGALSNSSSGGSTLVAESEPSTHPMSSANEKSSVELSSYILCPTYASSTSNGCSASTASLWLTYNSCHFASSTSLISGFELLLMQPTTGSLTANCGTFPDPTAGASSGSLVRQYVSASGSNMPGSLTRTDDDGKIYTIDNATANLANFDSVVLATIANGGYGASVSFNSNGGRSGLTIGHHVSSNLIEHSVYGTLTVTETARTSTVRTVSGSVKVYHDKLRVVGTSVFSNVTHSNTCCLPISGTITTTFAGGTNTTPTIAGLAFVGKSESLQFTGCGTGTLTNTDGTVNTVSMNRCF